MCNLSAAIRLIAELSKITAQSENSFSLFKAKTELYGWTTTSLDSPVLGATENVATSFLGK